LLPRQQLPKKLGTQFTRKLATPNLTCHQQRLLKGLQNSEEFIVLPCDKNLGPCIIKRTKYIQAALDHLSNTATYKWLKPNDAQQSIIGVEQNIIKFLGDYHHSISKDENTFLWGSLEVNDKYSYFYITAKVHKTPWKPRLITLTAGSITQGLGSWVDQELKPIVKKLPSYIRSLAHLLKQLKAINYNPSNVLFFSCDAVSMYNNIDTAHALEVLHPFLRTLPLCAGCQTDAITVALEIIMRQSIFKFGDTFLRQKSGTAMGTPPGANYTKLYYSTWEIDFVDYFRTSLALYCRYIDNGIGLWIHRIQTRTSTNSTLLPFKLLWTPLVHLNENSQGSQRPSISWTYNLQLLPLAWNLHSTKNRWIYTFIYRRSLHTPLAFFAASSLVWPNKTTL
jgi:hypothetical protein